MQVKKYRLDPADADLKAQGCMIGHPVVFGHVHYCRQCLPETLSSLAMSLTWWRKLNRLLLLK